MTTLHQQLSSDDFTVTLDRVCKTLMVRVTWGMSLPGRQSKAQFTVTYSDAGSYTNTASASGIMALSGGNFAQLTDKTRQT